MHAHVVRSFDAIQLQSGQSALEVPSQLANAHAILIAQDWLEQLNANLLLARQNAFNAQMIVTALELL